MHPLFDLKDLANFLTLLVYRIKLEKLNIRMKFLLFYRCSGANPVCFAIRDSIFGPSSSRS